MRKRRIRRLEPEKLRLGTPAWESSDEELREEWAAEQEMWKGVGIDPTEMLSILRRSRNYRLIYQDLLQTRSEFDVQKREVKRVLAIIKKVEGSLSKLTNWEPLVFESIADDFKRWVQRHHPYLENLANRPRGPVGVPAEGWLRPFTVELMELFRTHGLSGEKLQTAVERALGLAGHEDVVSSDKIRYIVKKERARDLRFGARPKKGSAPLPVATPSESPAPGPEAGHTPPPVTDEATPSEPLPASPGPLPPDAS